MTDHHAQAPEQHEPGRPELGGYEPGRREQGGHKPSGHEPGGREHDRVAELVRAIDVPAPQRLHERVQAMVTEHERAKARPRARMTLAARLRPAFVAMALAAAAGAAIALLTGPAQPQGPSLSATSALALSAATQAAPGESAAHHAQLNAAVDGVSFPYWAEHFGWRATGSRTDRVAGRHVMTVYYGGPDHSRIGYAIVGGTPAPAAAGGTVVWRRGTPYRVLQSHGEPVVTWQREGRRCVLSGRHVSSATLLRLASWGDGRAAV